MRRSRIALTLVLLVAGSTSRAAQNAEDTAGDELKRLMPDLVSACEVVRDNPPFWRFRAFPNGPLGLEVRNAKPQEADTIRNVHLGMAARACEVPASEITAAFFCGPECPKGRRDRMVQRLPGIRKALEVFDRLASVRMVSLWIPRGEFRVNDVFVMGGRVREAIPSAKLGLVPSGDWKPWDSIEAYLATIHVSKGVVDDLVQQMSSLGISAMIRDPSAMRLVGVGVGDNESGLLFLHKDAQPPHVGDVRPDGSKYQMVENVAPGVWFYETS